MMPPDMPPDFFLEYRLRFKGEHKGQPVHQESNKQDMTEDEALRYAKGLLEYTQIQQYAGTVFIDQRRVIAGVRQGWEPYQG